MHGYMQDFSVAPGTLGDNDDDSEDAGRAQGFESKNLMNYDSDDAGREEGAEASELIQLDSLPTRRSKQVPKL